MSEKLELDLIINAANSAKTVGELRQSLKDINTTLGKTAVGSEQYNKLALAAGNVKAELMDMKQTIKALDPDASFGIISKSIGGIASGFQAAAASAALFGGESQELQKSLLKVQAAMALANAVKDLQDFKDTFSQLNIIIKANPILFIAGAVAAISAAMPSIVDWFRGAGEEAAELRKQSEQIKKLTDLQVNALDNQIKILRAQKKTDAEIEQILLQQVDAKIRAAKSSLIAASATLEQKKNEDSLYETLLKIMIWYKKLLGDQQGAIMIENELAKNREERLQEFVDAVDKAKTELDNLTTERKIIEINADNEIHDNWKTIQDEKEKRTEELLKKEIDMRRKWMEDAKRIGEEDNFNEQKRLDEKNKIHSDYTDKLIIGVTENAERDKKDKLDALNREIELSNARVAIAHSVASSLASIGQLFIGNAKKLEKFQKAIAITELIIDTGRALASAAAGAAKAVAATGNPISGIVVYATTVAQVLANMAKAKAILSKVGGADAPQLAGIGGGGGGGGSIQAPTVNPVTNASTLLNPDGTVKTDPTQQDQRVYVLETDITRTQRRVNSIENKAKIE